MNKSMLIGAVLGVAVATAGGVLAGYQLLRDEEPPIVVETVATPIQGNAECEQNGPRDDKRIAGTVIGAAVGGAVGRDVGDRDITTAAGAAAGALAGNQLQKKVQERRARDNTC
jgi:uncharacterized protein YcfJ